MNQPKEYELKTLKEILQVVTSENIECFITDFGSWLHLKMVAREIQEKLPAGIEIKDNYIFRWIDDKKNNITIKIKIENK